MHSSWKSKGGGGGGTWVYCKQCPLAGEFAKTSDPPNFCDSRRRIWRVFSEFSEFSKFGKFGEGRLDPFIPKNIFFLYIKRPSLKIRQICQIRQSAVTDSPDSPTFAKGHFWKNVTRIRYIRTSNLPFSRIWGEWPLLSFLANYFEGGTWGCEKISGGVIFIAFLC